MLFCSYILYDRVLSVLFIHFEGRNKFQTVAQNLTTLILSETSNMCCSGRTVIKILFFVTIFTTVHLLLRVLINYINIDSKFV